MSLDGFRDCPDGTPVKGGRSFSNGNCVTVTRIGDFFLIRDDKLGDASPTWVLATHEFELLGRRLAGTIGQFPDYLVIPFNEDAAFVMERVAHRTYRWSLTGEESFTFDLDEVSAFSSGYVDGQFPVDGPLREFVAVSRHALSRVAT